MVDQTPTYDQMLAENAALKKALAFVNTRQGVERAFNAQRLFGQLIIREDDENRLLNSICKIAVEEAGYKLAWIGLAMDDKTVLPVASAGFDKDYLNHIKISWGDDKLSEGPTGQAIKTGKYIVMQDILDDPNFEPWKASAVKNGFKSLVALPIFFNKIVFGALNIYSDETNAFGNDEIKILLLAASDLSIGISNIRQKQTIELQATELLKAKERAEESEAFLSNIFENIPAMIFIKDANDLRYMSINRTGEQLLGYRKEELVGKNDYDIFTKEQADFFVLKDKSVFENNELLIVEEEEVNTKSGVKTLYTKKIAVKDHHGNNKYLLGISEDITNRKEIEKELVLTKEKAHDSEERYKQIFDKTLDHIFILDITNDQRYKVLVVNPIHKRESGFFEPGKFMEECVPAELCTVFKQNFDHCVHEQKSISYEETILLKDIEQTYYTQLIPIKNSKGHIYRLIGISRNISETKNLTNQLLIQNERLTLLNADLLVSKEKAEGSDRLKSAFLANMSHEIRTPMNGILGFAELLKMPDLTGEQQEEYIQIIKKSGDRMLNIINDIVDISKIESGQMKILLTETKINEQTEFITTFFRPEAEKKGIRITCKNGLSDNQAIIRSDREKVYAILTNLIKNAIKYTDTGIIELGYHLRSASSYAKSELTTTDPSDRLEFYVKDTGIGVPKDRLQAIFDRFVQADISDSRAFQGAGLGLSISKAYVQMLGGEIWVESEEGQGSVFYFSLPYYPLKERAWPVDSDKFSMDVKAAKKLKILIVEDDEISQMLISIAFIKYSKEILKADNGIDAVEICRNNPDLDLVFMDIKLPGIDGYETTRQIRCFNTTVYIIAQTAYGLINERETALRAGCNEFVAKPLNINFLKELIHTQFENLKVKLPRLSG